MRYKVSDRKAALRRKASTMQQPVIKSTLRDENQRKLSVNEAANETLRQAKDRNEKL